MDDVAFRRILRAAFAMTLTSPFVATAASCGGATSSDPTGPAPSGTPIRPSWKWRLPPSRMSSSIQT